MDNRARVNGIRWGFKVLLVGLMGALLVLLVACGTGGVDMAPTEPPATEEAEPTATEELTAGAEAQVTMENSTFEPEEITIEVGTMVRWSNQDQVQHTVTAGTRDNPTDLFDQSVPAGGSFSFTFDEPGTYEYFCAIHPGMSGVVIVEE